MVPLWRTNKAACGVKVLPMTIELIHDIGGVKNKVSQNPAVLAR